MLNSHLSVLVPAFGGRAKSVIECVRSNEILTVNDDHWDSEMLKCTFLTAWQWLKKQQL